MNASKTARERVRAELVREITEIARQQLATDGAAGLSLRAVAREMGMVSSAIYRYFPSRDELLTTLIIDGYNALGAAVEWADAASPRDDHAGRWLATCRAVRAWALAHPHEYALVYGSPVPGYRAPERTIAPASRAAAVFGKIIADAHRAATEVSAAGAEASAAGAEAFAAGAEAFAAGAEAFAAGGEAFAAGGEASTAAAEASAGAAAADGNAAAGTGTGTGGSATPAGATAPGAGTGGSATPEGATAPGALARVPDAFIPDAARLRETILDGVPDHVAAAALIAWSGLFGLVSFELFGQFENVVTDRAAFFDYAAASLGRLAGLAA